MTNKDWDVHSVFKEVDGFCLNVEIIDGGSFKWEVYRPCTGVDLFSGVEKTLDQAMVASEVALAKFLNPSKKLVFVAVDGEPPVTYNDVGVFGTYEEAVEYLQGKVGKGFDLKMYKPPTNKHVHRSLSNSRFLIVEHLV